MSLSNFLQALFCQDEMLIHLCQHRKLPLNGLIAGNIWDVCIFINSRPKSLPATVESSILLPWVKGDSVEAEAISWPPIALLSKPSMSVKEKGEGFPRLEHSRNNQNQKPKTRKTQMANAIFIFFPQQTSIGSIMYQVCKNFLSEY